MIIEFGIKWMKATTDALQDKKEEDEDPNQVTKDPFVKIVLCRF